MGTVISGMPVSELNLRNCDHLKDLKPLSEMPLRSLILDGSGVTDLSPLKASTDTPMELILGYSTLSQADWFFDFPRRRWGITRINAG